MERIQLNEARENHESTLEENCTSEREEPSMNTESSKPNFPVERRTSRRTYTTGNWWLNISPLIFILSFCIVLDFKNPGATSVLAIGTTAATIIRAWQRTKNRN
jgi:hypothetical protein